MKRPKSQRPHRPLLLPSEARLAAGLPTWRDRLTNSTLIGGMSLTSRFASHTGISEAQDALRLAPAEKFNIEPCTYERRPADYPRRPSPAMKIRLRTFTGKKHHNIFVRQLLTACPNG